MPLSNQERAAIHLNGLQAALERVAAERDALNLELARERDANHRLRHELRMALLSPEERQRITQEALDKVVSDQGGSANAEHEGG